MKKAMFDMIKNNKTEYRKSYLLFNSVLISVLVLTVVVVLLFINIDSFQNSDNIVKITLLIISLLTGITLLFLYGNRFKDDSIKAESYREFSNIYNTVTISLDTQKKEEFRETLTKTLKTSGYKIVSSKTKNSISFNKHTFNPFLLSFITKKFIVINDFEKLSVKYIENKIAYELRKIKNKFNPLKFNHVYVCFISDNFSEDIIEYIKYTYKYKDEFFNFIVPIGIEISTRKVYFKKRQKLFQMAFNNLFNYTIYDIFGSQNKKFINRKILNSISVIIGWVSVVFLFIYLERTIVKGVWLNKYIIISIFTTLFASIIVSLRDVTKVR